MKTGIGVSESDKQPNLSTRGLINALSVEVVDSNGSIIGADGFLISGYDYISLSYTGSNLTTVVYKSGGSGGTTIATLTLAYGSSDNLISVTKS